MGLRDAAVCFDSLIQFTLYLVQIPGFTIDKIPLHYDRASSMSYICCDTVIAALLPTFHRT